MRIWTSLYRQIVIQTSVSIRLLPTEFQAPIQTALSHLFNDDAVVWRRLRPYIYPNRQLYSGKAGSYIAIEQAAL